MVVAYRIAREACNHVSADLMLNADFRILLDPQTDAEVEWARRIETIWNFHTENAPLCQERTSGIIPTMFTP